MSVSLSVYVSEWVSECVCVYLSELEAGGADGSSHMSEWLLQYIYGTNPPPQSNTANI